jgi:hypothetical protein
MSLLDKAKARTPKKQGAAPREITNDQIELALGWLQGEVTYSAIMEVMKLHSGSNIYGFISIALREAYVRNRITLI